MSFGRQQADLGPSPARHYFSNDVPDVFDRNDQLNQVALFCDEPILERRRHQCPER